MKNKLLIATTLLLSLVMVGCGVSSSSGSGNIKTSRITKQTANAIKAEETNEIKLSDGRILLPKGYRYIILPNGEKDKSEENNDLKAYAVFNPDVSNAIADKYDGREEGEYENAVKKAWEEAKELAEKKANKGIGKFFNKKKETDDDVFVFDTTAYTTAYNENTFMYIYEGVDRSSPQEYLDDSTIKKSFNSYISNTIGANIKLTSRIVDTNAMPKSIWKMVKNLPEKKELGKIPENTRWQYDESINGDYYAITFTAYSGDSVASTGGAYCYPHTYYGVYLLEKEAVKGSIRKYYGFVFGNVSDGTYFSEKEYEDVFSQIKKEFGLTKFFTLYTEDIWCYDKKTDFSNGKTYAQFEDLMILTNEYYIMNENKTIDIDEMTDEEAEKDDSITIVDFSGDE